MKTDFKTDIVMAILSGAFLSAGYALLAGISYIGFFIHGLLPVDFYEKMSRFFWLKSLSDYLPAALFLIGIAVFLDLFIRTNNPTYSPGSLNKPDNILKLIFSIAVVMGISALAIFKLLNGTDSFKVFDFSCLIADFKGCLWFSPNPLEKYILCGVIIGGAGALLFSRHGLLGNMGGASIPSSARTTPSRFIFNIAAGAAAGACSGLGAFFIFESLCKAHDILNRTVLWFVPPQLPLTGILFFPLPLLACLYLQVFLGSGMSVRSRAYIASAAILLTVFTYSMTGLLHNYATEKREYYTHNPHDIFEIPDRPQWMIPAKHDTFVAFIPGEVIAFDRTNKNNDSGPYSGDLYSKRNIRAALDKAKAPGHDALGYHIAVSFLIGKAGHDMDIEKELELFYRETKVNGGNMYYLKTRLENVAVTPFSKSLVDRLTDPETFHVTDSFISSLSAVYRHQGRDDEMLKVFARLKNRQMSAGYPFEGMSKVFVDGTVEGKLYSGGRPAAGIRVGLIANKKEKSLNMMRQNMTLGRETLAAACDTGRDGSFGFEGLGDDRAYYLVAALPGDIIKPRTNEQWSKVKIKAQNGPGIISVDRSDPNVDLGVIFLPSVAY